MNNVHRVWRGPTFAAGLPCQLDNCARCLFFYPIPCFSFDCTSPHCKSFCTTTGTGSHLPIKQYVAVQTASRDDEVVLYLVKELHSKINPSTSVSDPLSKSHVIDPDKDKLRILGEQETLAGLTTGNFARGYLVSSSKIYLYM